MLAFLLFKLVGLFHVTHYYVFVPSGFPSAILPKMQEICELSSETSSSLSVCLSFFSRQEGVSVVLPRERFVYLFECLLAAISQVSVYY